MEQFDVVIIGSGLGGLLCGYILGREGFSVGILEKHTQTGGNLQNFTRQGHSFDTGIHYIGSMAPGQTLHQYWKFAGLTGKLNIQQLDVDGFDRVTLGEAEYPLAQGFENFIERLSSCFPDERQAVASFIERILVISKSFPLYNLEFSKGYPGGIHRAQNAYNFIESLSFNPRLAGVLAGNNFLYAGNKHKTPLYIAALINHSFISSAWRLEGGSRQIADVLVQGIIEQGGRVFTRVEVTGISHEGDEFRLETKEGEEFISSILISNTHPSSTLKMLAPGLLKKSYRQRVQSLENSVSSFILNIILKPGTFPYLNYNIHYFRNEKVWTSESSKGARWPENYLMYTPLHGPVETYARTIIIMTYMQFDEVRKWEVSRQGKRGKDYLAFKQERTERLLNLVEKKFPGLKACIEYSEASTPLTYRDYTGSPEGSLYGISKDCNDTLMTTVLPRTKIPNFFFTGQNISLHGALGVTIGALLTCGEILGMEYLMHKIKQV